MKEQGIEQGIEIGIGEKERIIVTRGWKRGMAPQDIADLADMPMEKVEAIIRELEMEPGS